MFNISSSNVSNRNTSHWHLFKCEDSQFLTVSVIHLDLGLFVGQKTEIKEVTLDFCAIFPFFLAL